MTRLWVLTAVLLVVSLGVDLLIGVDLPAFGAVYGFASCVVIVIASKWLGKLLLQRREGYYDAEGAGGRDG